VCAGGKELQVAALPRIAAAVLLCSALSLISWVLSEGVCHFVSVQLEGVRVVLMAGALKYCQWRMKESAKL